MRGLVVATLGCALAVVVSGCGAGDVVDAVVPTETVNIVYAPPEDCAAVKKLIDDQPKTQDDIIVVNCTDTSREFRRKMMEACRKDPQAVAKHEGPLYIWRQDGKFAYPIC